jgi:hypothetical protein
VAMTEALAERLDADERLSPFTVHRDLGRE